MALEQVGIERADFSNKFRLTMNIFRGHGLKHPPQETEVAEFRWFKELERGAMWDSDFDYFELLKAGAPFRQYSLYSVS